MNRIASFMLLFPLLLFPQPRAEQQPWSVRIADSFLRQHPDSIVYPDEEKSKRWNYEQGLMLEAFYRMSVVTMNANYAAYLRKNLEHYIGPNGQIATYKLSEFNIDNITPGVAVLRALDLFRDQRYRIAADSLRKQLSLHPRTSEGGFWHKRIYPNQMWLDGLYMGEPFYALYAKKFNDTAAFSDIVRQFVLIEKHLKDSTTGLYYHGWDESRTMGWADQQTGRSPNFWGRSIGWYAMALVDVLEILPASYPQRKELLRILRDLMPAVLRARDQRTNLWFQVVDRIDAEGNYPEASASAMFVYAMAKGVNRGYLPASFVPEAKRSFDAILGQFVSVDANGDIFLRDVVKVSGLGGNPFRDGSVAYYLSEPRRTNDFKGYGPFLMAAIEIERLK